jgi:peptidoglycan/LPS O-acetylase OafA/YrhL
MQQFRLTFQHQSQSGDDCWHSVLISLLRGLAAIEVAAAHLRAATFPGVRSVADPSLWFQGLAFGTGFAHQAVLVFFIISGWLVGGSLLNRIGHPGAIAGYAIDRLTRLWTVLIPTFVLTLAFGLGAGVISSNGIEFTRQEYSVAAFVGNLVGLQTIFVGNFGGNFSLWSLANETWYYVLFPLLVAPFCASGRALRLGCGTLLILLLATLPTDITLFFTLWLLGVAFSRVRIDCSHTQRALWLVLLVGVAVYYRLTGATGDLDSESFLQDLVCSLMFLVFLSSVQFKAAPGSRLVRPIARIGSFFANFSFSLYVLHVPLINLLQYWSKRQFGLGQLSPAVPLHFFIYLGMLAALLGGAYLFYLMFELHTYRIRRLLKNLVARGGPAQPETAALPVKSLL